MPQALKTNVQRSAFHRQRRPSAARQGQVNRNPTRVRAACGRPPFILISEWASKQSIRYKSHTSENVSTNDAQMQRKSSKIHPNRPKRNPGGAPEATLEVNLRGRTSAEKSSTSGIWTLEARTIIKNDARIEPISTKMEGMETEW